MTKPTMMPQGSDDAPLPQKRKKRAVATYLDKRRIEEELFAATEQIVESDWRQRIWKAGETFDTVAKRVNPEFDKDHVKRLAEAMGVELQPAPPEPDLTQRVVRLENQVAMLLALIENLMAEEIRRVQGEQAANRDPEAQEWEYRDDSAGRAGGDYGDLDTEVRSSGDAGDADRDVVKVGPERASTVG